MRQALDVLSLAEKLGLRDLTATVMERLSAQPPGVFDNELVSELNLVVTSPEHAEALDSRAQRLLQLLDTRAASVLHSRKLNELSLTAWETLLCRESFTRLPQIRLFSALAAWSKHRTEQLASSANTAKNAEEETRTRNLLCSLRYEEMTPQDLLLRVRPSGLVPADLILDAVARSSFAPGGMLLGSADPPVERGEGQEGGSRELQLQLSATAAKTGAAIGTSNQDAMPPSTRGHEEMPLNSASLSQDLHSYHQTGKKSSIEVTFTALGSLDQDDCSFDTVGADSSHPRPPSTTLSSVPPPAIKMEPSEPEPVVGAQIEEMPNLFMAQSSAIRGGDGVRTPSTLTRASIDYQMTSTDAGTAIFVSEKNPDCVTEKDDGDNRSQDPRGSGISARRPSGPCVARSSSTANDDSSRLDSKTDLFRPTRSETYTFSPTDSAESSSNEDPVLMYGVSALDPKGAMKKITDRALPSLTSSHLVTSSSLDEEMVEELWSEEVAPLSAFDFSDEETTPSMVADASPAGLRWTAGPGPPSINLGAASSSPMGSDIISRIKCSKCPAEFMKSKELDAHARHFHTGSAQGAHPCDMCGQRFYMLKSLETHVLVAHGHHAQPFLCASCGQRFAWRANRDSHSRTCTASVTASVDGSLQSPHSSTRSRPKTGYKQKYKCRVCGLRFDLQSQVSHHQAAKHPGARPYKCRKCGEGFRNRALMDRHQRRPHNTPPTQQNRAVAVVGGSNSSYNAGDLDGSAGQDGGQSYNNSDEKYKCDLCARSFRSEKSLRTHKTLGHNLVGEGAHACMDCGRRFFELSGLRRHAVVHSDDRPFSCGVCQASFKSKQNLKTHLRQVHNAQLGRGDSHASTAAGASASPLTSTTSTNEPTGLANDPSGLANDPSGVAKDRSQAADDPSNFDHTSVVEPERLPSGAADPVSSLGGDPGGGPRADDVDLSLSSST